MQKLSSLARTQPAEKHLLYGLITLIALAPLPFGSNRPLPLAVISCFVGVLAIYWGVFAARERVFVRVSLQRIKWLAGAMLLLLVWLLLQILPLALPGFTYDFWQVAMQNLPEAHISPTISVVPHLSWVELYKIIIYIMIFWLVLQVARSTNNANKILRAVLYSGAVYCAYGLFIQSTGANKILWLDKEYYSESLTSTFVNRNSFATYAGVVLIIAVSLFLNDLFDKIGHLNKREFYRQLLQRVFSNSLKSLVLIFIVAAALVLTASRAGIACTVLGLLVFLLLSNFTKQLKKRRGLFLLLTILIITIFTVIFSAGGNLAVERMRGMKGDATYRGLIYDATLNAINDFPLQGTGMGSFTDIYSAYSNEEINRHGDTFTNHAHNSYLELMLEMGVPAALLLFAVFVAIWLKSLLAIWRRRQSAYMPAITVASTILIATHALFDFSAQIPALMIVFLVLLAVGMAQSWSRQIDISDASDDIVSKPIYHKLATRGAMLAGVILCFAGLWQFYGIYTGASDAKLLRNNGFAAISQAQEEGVLTAKSGELLASAEKNLVASIKLAPVDAYSWLYLAYVRMLNTDDMQQGISKLLTASISNGYYAKRLVFFRLQLIPIVWPYASPDEQVMFTNQAKLALKLDPKQAMLLLDSDLGRRILGED